MGVEWKLPVPSTLWLFSSQVALLCMTDSMHMNFSKLQDTMMDRKAWHTAVHGLQRVRPNLATEQKQHHQIMIDVKGLE